MLADENKKSTKEIFLTEALRLFAKSGYEAVTVAEIADAVNVSAPALYKHYKNKQDLFDAVLEMGEKGYERQMSKLGVIFDRRQTVNKELLVQMTEEELLESMKNMFFATLHDEYPAMMRKLMTVEQFHIAKMARTYNERYVENAYRAYANLFEVLMEAGKLRKADPYTLSVAYVSPVTVLIGVCDREPEKEEWAMKLLENHVREFNRVYRL